VKVTRGVGGYSESRPASTGSAWFRMIISTCIFLFVLEGLIRWFSPQKLSYPISQWDPDVGFINMPGIKGYTKTQDFETTMQINSKGLRDREFVYAKSSDTYRIGIFGDSFTFGEGVQDNETYAKELEKLLQEAPRSFVGGRKIEVLNMGLGKSGTSHQLAFYRKEGHKYDLDLIIIGFSPSSDFYDNWGGVFFLQDGELVHHATPYSHIRKIQMILYAIPFYKWLATHSHLASFLRGWASVYDDGKRNARAGLQNKHALETSMMAGSESEIDQGPFLNMYRLTEKLMDEFREDVETRGKLFLVVFVPNRDDKTIEAYTSGLVPPHVTMTNALKQHLRTAGVPLIDLRQTIGVLPNKNVLYFPHEGHMNAAGHELIAFGLYRDLIHDLLPQTSTTSS